MTTNAVDATSSGDPKPRRRPRDSLNQREIVDAALRILSRDGYYGLSMAKLAKELDCGPMSLYSHFQHKRHLLDLVIRRVFEGIYVPDPDMPWAEELTKQMRTFRAALLAHPGLGRIVAEGMIRSPTVDRFLEAGLACIRNEVEDEELTVRVFFSLLVFTEGSVVHESARAYEIPRAAYVDRWRDREAEWPEGAYPQMRELMPHLLTIADDIQFDFAYAALLRGLVDEVREARA